MIIDLSHPIHEGMPVYPGTEVPVIEFPFTVQEHGFNEARLHMVTHTGTHMDAPAHMIPNGKTLDMFPAGHFFGKAVCIPFNSLQDPITQDVVRLVDRELPDFILFRTGWSRFWGQDAYFSDFPVLSEKSVQWLCEKKIRGVGFDAISVDPVGVKVFENHLRILGSGMLIIENLTCLEKLPEKSFQFACFPLPVRGADGSPVRAMALTS